MNPLRATLAISVSILMAAAIGQSFPPPGKNVAASPAEIKKRIDYIHAGFQSALEDLTMTNLQTVKVQDADGKVTMVQRVPTFGFDRQTPFDILHDKVLRDTHIGRFDESISTKIDVYGASCFGKPLKTGKLRVKDKIWIAGDAFDPKSRVWAEKVANRSLSQLETKELIKGTMAGREYEARPLRLTKQECLPCHTESKMGDPLAILVYEIKTPKR